jgi:hypothetical protein
MLAFNGWSWSQRVGTGSDLLSMIWQLIPWNAAAAFASYFSSKPSNVFWAVPEIIKKGTENPSQPATP